MSINGWLMVRDQKIWKHSWCSGTERFTEDEKAEDEQYVGGNFSNLENSTLHQKAPAFCYTYKTEKTKNYKNIQMKARKITKKSKPKLRKLRKSQIKLKMKQTKFQQKLE